MFFVSFVKNAAVAFLISSFDKSYNLSAIDAVISSFKVFLIISFTTVVIVRQNLGEYRENARSQDLPPGIPKIDPHLAISSAPVPQ